MRSVPIKLVVIAIALLVASGGATQSHAAVLPASNCGAYFEASAPGAKSTPSVILDRLLADLNVAIPCLIAVVRSLQAEVGASGTSTDASSRLLSVTAAFRAIMTRLVSSDKTAGNTKGLDDFIANFRATDDLDIVSVLSYGTRSDLLDLRLNSVSILGNVIDNKTVCVPLAHLNDPSLLDSANGINGRANLLAVISVVAPWAYKENFDNITRTTQAIHASINEGDPNLKYTSSALENIKVRLGSQTDNSNKTVPLPSQWRLNCQTYVRSFVPKIVAADNVKY